jgi:D-alanyl-D-alanine dipeptidase
MAKNKKWVWYVHRPTYLSKVEHPALWKLEKVERDSARDRMLESGRTVNDCGELVELPGEWWRFSSRAHAEAWLRSERWQWERRSS